MDNIVQGTPEWHQIRVGKVTASKVADIIAKTKTGYSASRANYAAQLITERLTGLPTEGFTNAAMQWGTENEPEARAAYEFNCVASVVEVGFVPHPTIGETGASPDGLVGDDGLVEIKCPNTATHIKTLRGGSVPGDYVTQMQWQMACTGRKWCDFVSYDPRMPESMRFFCQRVDRDDAMIADLEREVVAFLNEVRAAVIDLRRRYDPPVADEAADMLMAG
ncbi:lambda exonuclease family protein [Rhizobium sp. BT-226]|uniref:lambda exonuclease family protein n=1 Tax=Rhizobium sp. BT-226 TaxID=2986922 RepID=UPI0021F73D5B|nr:lambda exonuclease family protein [Rhizobium sp. BT-226]MCW0014865.1 YqaJ viral recombinase family protein [Rhizobium sp. BT-226]